MSIATIAAVSATPAMADVSAATPAVATEPAFQGVLDHLANLNTQMLQNRDALAQVALGDMDNLHQVMMNAEKTRLEFDLVLQVRNKLLDAYQELMRMQV